jgi:gamma-glutamyl hercynylcysteine S-oxide hydrolase
MCRHFAYVGDEVAIKSLLFDPPLGLVHQAWAPRWQQHGTMNVDGYGVGWYAAGDPLPARYRQSGPIWADDCLADLARVTRTSAMLCAVRSASAGTDMSASAAAPYGEGRWLFSLNGALVGWSAAAGGSVHPRRKSAAAASAQPAGEPITEPVPAAPPSQADGAAAVLRLAGSLSVPELLALQARCDTALLWALVLARLRTGEPAASALAATVAGIWAAGGTGRFNLLLTDGRVIAATAAGDSLCYLHRDGGVIVASEPFDDDEDWRRVPDGSVVEATTAGVTVSPIRQVTAPARFAPAGPAGHPNGRREA